MSDLYQIAMRAWNNRISHQLHNIDLNKTRVPRLGLFYFSIAVHFYSIFSGNVTVVKRAID